MTSSGRAARLRVEKLRVKPLFFVCVPLAGSNSVVRFGIVPQQHSASVNDAGGVPYENQMEETEEGQQDGGGRL